MSGPQQAQGRVSSGRAPERSHSLSRPPDHAGTTEMIGSHRNRAALWPRDSASLEGRKHRFARSRLILVLVSRPCSAGSWAGSCPGVRGWGSRAEGRAAWTSTCTGGGGRPPTRRTWSPQVAGAGTAPQPPMSGHLGHSLSSGRKTVSRRDASRSSMACKSSCTTLPA